MAVSPTTLSIDAGNEIGKTDELDKIKSIFFKLETSGFKPSNFKDFYEYYFPTPDKILPNKPQINLDLTDPKKYHKLLISRCLVDVYTYCDIKNFSDSKEQKTYFSDLKKQITNFSMFKDIPRDAFTLSFITTFYDAASFGKVKDLKLILKSPKLQDISIAAIEYALQGAVRNSQVEAIKILLDTKINPRFSDISKDAFLHIFKIAVSSGNLDIMKLLMQTKNFEKFSSDEVGDFFAIAAGFGKLDAMIILMKDNRFNISFEKRGVAFTYAAQGGHIEIMGLLISLDSLKNIPIRYIATAMDFAIENRDLEAIKLILQCGRYFEIPLWKRVSFHIKASRFYKIFC